MVPMLGDEETLAHNVAVGHPEVVPEDIYKFLVDEHTSLMVESAWAEKPSPCTSLIPRVATRFGIDIIQIGHIHGAVGIVGPYIVACSGTHEVVIA